MTRTDLKHLRLSALRISPLNMRHGRKAPDVTDILPSIREKGIRQTLLVRREGDGYGVVAGRRRFFALKQIAKETGTDPSVPCAIMDEADAASAIEASLIENVARLPATEMQQYAAFRKLHEEGRPVEDIAAFFGVTPLRVRRVLALAGLNHQIRRLYADEEIDRETVRALTLATPDQQAGWLKLWNDPAERAPMGRACRAWVTGGSAITTGKALFDLALYDGAVIADLFGEEAVFADAGAFWQAQAEAVAAREAAYLARGWAGVTVLERGVWFQTWEHEKTSKKQGGKVIVEQRPDGTVTFHEGWLKLSEARRVKAGGGGETAQPTAIRPEMSGPMADYVTLHRHGAAQAGLIAHPVIALRLMAAHALCGSALWSVRPHSPGAVKEATLESLASGPAAKTLLAARARVEALFDARGAPVPRRNADPYHLTEVFAALLGMADAQVLQVMALAMAETLCARGPVPEAVLHACGTDMAAHWRPDDAFFDLLRDRRVITAFLADAASPDAAGNAPGQTARALKEALRKALAKAGSDGAEAWRPGWMQVPPAGHVEGAACVPADAWGQIAGLFDAQPA